ncbi:hypothetical protein HGRIS_014770 [Hohenbuehelia grisea]|uniref:P-loop containing nucleoside triphosphate hydrolase protein n=1 Tax=Hohenbuehelia grisea TaxID=104357 RepID=A0ABR3IQR4_9AGAR
MSMEPQAQELAQFLIKRLQSTPSSSRLVIGLCGIPASGKSTLAVSIVNWTNKLLHTAQNVDSGADRIVDEDAAILVGLDGWHLTRAQLDALPEPQLAHDRRGAHWTFDGPAYVDFLRSLRAPLTTRTPPIVAPSFDHAVKDPTPASVSILPHHRIIVIEGLYTFLNIEPWADGAALLDERWYLSVDPVVAQERLVKRHVQSGVARDMAEAVWRATENDMPNGKFITENMLQPTRIIESITDLAISS